MSRVHRLVVENVQGIPHEKELTLSGDSLLLYGENGTGKSSFISAIELLVNGDVESIPRKGPGFNSRILNRDRLDSDAIVEVSFTGEGEAKRVNDNEPSVHESVEEWFQTMAENLPLLYRRALLDFIEGKPRERYDEVSKWIGHGQVDHVFEQLRAAKKTASQNASQSKQELKKELDSWKTALDVNEIPETFSDLSSSVNQPIEDADLEIPSTPEDAEEKAKNLTSSLPPELPDTTETLRETLKSWKDGPPASLASELEGFRGAKETQAELLEEHAEGADELENILEHAIRYFQKTESAECPVCERRDLPENLLERMRSRKEPLSELAEVRTDVKEKEADLERVIEDQKRRWPENPDAFEDSDLETYLEVRTEALAILDGIPETGPPEEWPIQEGCEELITVIDEREERINSEHQEKKAKARRVLGQLSKWSQIESKRSSYENDEAVASKAEALYEAAQKARHSLFQDRLDELVSPVEEFYESVHPGERLESIGLEMPEPTPGGKKDKQAKIRFQFEDQEEADPRVHLSDGHLDTLGLAFFLMNKKREVEESGAGSALLVLDDVISSVDAPHRRRVAREILERFDEWQLFVTTHDKIWFNRFQTLARIEGHKLKTKTIRWWEREEGPQLKEFEDFYESLKRRLDEKDTAQALASNAGVLLEQICDEVRVRFKLSVTSKPGDKYSLGDIFPKVRKRLKKDPDVNSALLPGWYQENKELFDNLHAALESRDNLRNVVGAHWNEKAREFSETEAEDFARGVIALYEAFYCTAPDGCGRPVEPIEEDRAPARCRCGGLKYLPSD